MRFVRVSSGILALALACHANSQAKTTTPPKDRAVVRDDAPDSTRFRQADQDYQEGRRLAKGGTDAGYLAAEPFYRKAAQAGHPAAQYQLGYLLENGLGVMQDLQKAAVWYRRAAQAGDAEAQNNLGVLCASGQGVAQDDKEAVRWYRRAAAQEDPEAMSNLAMMLFQGRGVERDVGSAANRRTRAMPWRKTILG
jgi:TPR repeat protein